MMTTHKPISSNKKKIIRMQDCTTWLSLSNHQKSGFTSLLNGHGSNYATGSSPPSANPINASSAKSNNQIYLADAKVFEAAVQANSSSNQTNRINFLLNRKNTRANT